MSPNERTEKSHQVWQNRGCYVLDKNKFSGQGEAEA